MSDYLPHIYMRSAPQLSVARERYAPPPRTARADTLRDLLATYFPSAAIALDGLTRLADKWRHHAFGTAARRTAQQLRREQSGWVEQTLRLALEGLGQHASDERLLRPDLLRLLDLPLHVRQDRRWSRAMSVGYQQSMRRALGEIAAEQALPRVWRMYNMGFVVKSASATIGFDLHPGRGFERPMTGYQLDQLADSLDVLFVTHNHVDHCYVPLLERMADAGKWIVMPNRPLFWRNGRLRQQIVPVYNGATEIGPLQIRSYPGMQQPLIRNAVYAVTLDGRTYVHNGDNERYGIYQRMTDEQVDVFLANCWTRMVDVTLTLRPRVLLTGHENELRHPRFQMVPYRKSLARVDAIRAHLGAAAPEAHVLHWGEGVSI